MRKTPRAKGKGIRVNYGRLYRLALRKRSLQRVCMDAGASRALAVRIASTFFAKNVFTYPQNGTK